MWGLQEPIRSWCSACRTINNKVFCLHPEVSHFQLTSMKLWWADFLLYQEGKTSDHHSPLWINMSLEYNQLYPHKINKLLDSLISMGLSCLKYSPNTVTTKEMPHTCPWTNLSTAALTENWNVLPLCAKVFWASLHRLVPTSTLWVAMSMQGHISREFSKMPIPKVPQRCLETSLSSILCHTLTGRHEVPLLGMESLKPLIRGKK